MEKFKVGDEIRCSCGYCYANGVIVSVESAYYILQDGRDVPFESAVKLSKLEKALK